MTKAYFRCIGRNGWKCLLTSKWAPRFLQCKLKCCTISSMTCFLWVTSFFVVFLKNSQTVKAPMSAGLVRISGYGKMNYCLFGFIYWLFRKCTRVYFPFSHTFCFYFNHLWTTCAYMTSETVQSLWGETLQPSLHRSFHHIVCIISCRLHSDHSHTQQNKHWCPIFISMH